MEPFASFYDTFPLLNYLLVSIVLALSYFLLHKRETTAKTTPPKLRKRRMSMVGMNTLISESESNLSIATSVFILDGVVAFPEFVAHMQKQMTAHSIFSRFVARVEGVNFVEMEDFHVQKNIQQIQLAEGQTPDEFASSITNTPLDSSLPLWQLCFIEDYQGRSYCVWRFHHCIGDGMSMAMAFLRLCDNAEEFDQLMEKTMAEAKQNRPQKEKPTLMKKFSKLCQAVVILTWSLWVVIKKMIKLLRAEPISILKVEGGKRKCLHHALSFKVQEVKNVGKKKNVTINDVMITCITGGLRRILAKEQPEILNNSSTVIRAAVPVNMRAPGIINQTGNKFSALVVDLPIGKASPIDRLNDVASSMNEAKLSLERQFTYMLGNVLGLFTDWIIRAFVAFTSSRISVAITNVRGPPIELEMCGKKISSSFGYVPPPPSVNVGFAIFSVGDKLGLTLSIDEKVMQHPHELLDSIVDEYEELKLSVI